MTQMGPYMEIPSSFPFSEGFVVDRTPTQMSVTHERFYRGFMIAGTRDQQ